MAERTLFARKSTGLVREIGLTVAIMVPMANAIGVGWQVRVFQGMGWYPVARTNWFLGIAPVTMAFLITGIGCLLSIYAFAVLTAAMPRAGGGYVAISRVLSPLWGMVATLFQWMGVSTAYGQITFYVILPFMLYGGYMGLVVPAFLTSPIGTFVLGIVVIAIFSGIAALGARQTGRLLQVIFWIPVAILILVLFLFLIASPSTMAAGTQAQFGASPTAYIQQALATGIAEGAVGYWAAVLGCIVVTYWAFIGYATTNFIAGEMKEASRNLPKAMFIATGAITVIYLIQSTLLVRVGGIAGVVQGFDLVGSVGWMVFSGSFGDLSAIGPWMPIFAHIQGVGMGIGTLTAWATLIFAVLWAANDIPPFILATSRMLFAMAFDRVLPERLADVDERWHSPVNAIIATSVVALLGAAAEGGLFSEGGIYLGATFKAIIDGFGMRGSNLWDAIFYSSFALACIAFPFVKPDIFERAPFRHSKTTVVVIGVLASLAQAFFIYSFVFTPKGGYYLPGLLRDFSLAGFAPWLATIVIAGVGAGFYYYYRSQAAVTGVDYTTIFAEIPPE